MAADISAQIGIDGEKQFKDSVRAIDSELKALNSEMKAAVAEFNASEDAEKSLAKQSQVLNDQIDKQKEKLSVLQNQYERQNSELGKLGQALEEAKQKFGENSEEAGKAQNAYNKQSAEVSKLRGQIAETNAKISDATKSLADLGKESENAGKGLDEASKHSKTFGDTLKGMLGATAITAGFKALSDGIKSAVNGFKDGINNAAKYGDSIDKQSQKLRVSAEDYQKLAFAAERSGTSIEVMATAQKSLASSGFNGTLMDAIQHVAGIADESERASAAMELFGKKAGTDMLPLLNSGAEGVQALYDEFEALGGVMSNEAVSAAAAYEDALTNFQTVMDGVKNRMLGDFLPGITDVMNGIVEIIKGNTEEGEKLIQQGFGDIQDKIQTFTKNVAENAPEMLKIGIDILTALITGIVASLPTLAAQAPEIVGVLVRGIANLLVQLGQVGIQMVRAIADELKNGLIEIYNIGADMVRGLWDGIASMSSWLRNQVVGWCRSIIDTVKDFFDINSPSRVMNKEVGVMLGKGLADGIDASAGYAIESMKALGQDLISATPSITSQLEMQTNANGTLAEGLVNGLSALGGNNPVNLSVQLVLSNGQLIAEQIFDDLLNVSKQRGVALA